ncbi:MAG: DUF87 domain-containing protein [Clostridiales bacterium]
MANLSAIPNSMVSYRILPAKGDYLDIVRRMNRNAQTKIQTTNDALEIQRAEIQIEASEYIMQRMDTFGEKIYEIEVTIMAMGRDKEEFETACKLVENSAQVHNITLRVLSHLQKEGMKIILPSTGDNKTLERFSSMPMFISAFVGGYPWSATGWNDKDGLYLARGNDNNSILMFDLWIRGGTDRVNSNMTIIGKSGMGKSTFVKHQIESQFAVGTKILILDPESEYMDITAALSGDWIDTAGNKDGRINPLQVRAINKNNNEDDDFMDINFGLENNKGGALIWHMQSLEIFFKLWLGNIDVYLMAALKDSLIQLYKRFNIDWETDVTDWNNEDFPIMSDLYQYIIDKEKELKEEKNSDYEIYHKLGFILKDISDGTASMIWNGYTTIHSEKDVICLDTNNLGQASTEVKRAQYYNILTWCWQRMTRNGQKERVILVADEAYTMIDPKVPESLIFMRNISKRARKYESALVVITQSIVDLLAPEVKMYGQALLDNPTYKVVFGTEGQNLIEISNLLLLTEMEQEKLSAQISRTGLFIAGSKRLFVNFKYPESFIERMGTAGGRG